MTSIEPSSSGKEDDNSPLVQRFVRKSSSMDDMRNLYKSEEED
jgi:hypothetical protein